MVALKRKIKLEYVLLFVTALIICTIITMFIYSKFAYAGTEFIGSYDGVDWEITDGVLTITGNSDSWKPKNANVKYWKDYKQYYDEIHVNGFTDGTLTDMSYMFAEMYDVKVIKFGLNFNTTNVTNMANMFEACISLTNLDVSNFDTSEVTRMTNMFVSCRSLTSLDLSNFDTSKVTNMEYMFDRCSSLTSLDLSSFNTTNITSMDSMFYDCSRLTSLNVSSFNTSNVTVMSNMFWGCSRLTSLDLSGFDTTNVISMNSMFCKCEKLEGIDLSNFNTSNGSFMSSMFYECSSLTSLDLSNFDTSEVTDMSYMFWGCSSLTSLGLSSFDTTNVISMRSMFVSCRSLTSLDLSKFNTSNVTSMSSMFCDCSGLTSLDLSSFDTTNVTSMDSMFDGCNSLTSLYISDNSANLLGIITCDNTYCLSDKTFTANVENNFKHNLHYVAKDPNGNYYCIDKDVCLCKDASTIQHLEKTYQAGSGDDQIEIVVKPAIYSDSSFTLEITKSNLDTTQDILAKFKKVQKQPNGQFIDLTLVKTDSTTTRTKVTDWGTLTNGGYIVVSIPLKENIANRTGYAVHRYHDGQIDTLKENPGPGEEGFIVDQTTGQIILKVNKFSIF